MEADVKKTAPYEESDIFGTIKAGEALEGIGDTPRPRQEAVNTFSDALYKGYRGPSKTQRKYPLCQPKISSCLLKNSWLISPLSPKALYKGNLASHISPLSIKNSTMPRGPCKTHLAGEVPKSTKARHRRNSGKTGPLNTGKLALAYLRYNVGGEKAGAWVEFGGLGALLINLARLLLLFAAQSMEQLPD